MRTGELRARGQQRVDGPLVSGFARDGELELVRAAAHEQHGNLFVAEVARDGVRGLAAAQRPDVDVAPGARIPHGEVVWIHRRANRLGILVEESAHPIHVAVRRGEQDVGSRAAGDEVPRHVEMIVNEVLRRRRLVIDVERVGVGAGVEQQVGDLDARGNVERRLPIAGARAHDVRIGDDHGAERVEHPQLRRRVGVKARSALEQNGGERRVRVLQQSETAGPPGALGVDVRAVRNQ